MDLKCPKPVWHSLVYDWKSYLKPFGRGSFVKSGEEKDELVNEWVTKVFVEQPLASHGSAKQIYTYKIHDDYTKMFMWIPCMSNLKKNHQFNLNSTLFRLPISTINLI